MEQMQNQMCEAAVLYLQERYSQACTIYENLAKRYTFVYSLFSKL